MSMQVKSLMKRDLSSRSSSTVKFTVQSMHTDAGRHFLPGFKSVQIYDETCDRGNCDTPRQCSLWQVFVYKFIFGAMIFLQIFAAIPCAVSFSYACDYSHRFP